jgi:hypothetical protein
VHAAYAHALGRAPDEAESDAALEFVASYEKALPPAAAAAGRDQPWSALARSLLATNEFLYLD